MSIIIIGGGVAGLSAANRLADLGFFPLVIESGDYSSARVCGEFISPETLPYLDKWNIHPDREIKWIELISKQQRRYTVALDPPAASMPRSELERQLLARLLSAGVEVRQKTSVASIQTPQTKEQDYTIQLTSAERLACRHLILSSGRFSGRKCTIFPYKGITGRFSGIRLDDGLQMYLLEGGYVGLSPNTADGCNLSLLSLGKKEIPSFLIDKVQGVNLLPPGWIEVHAPSFGAVPWPAWPNCYPIGDAAAQIPPITGQGLTMGILSGWLAADYLCNSDYKGYRKAWRKKFRTRLFLGLLLHKAVLHPMLTHCLLTLFPWLPKKAVQWTRG